MMLGAWLIGAALAASSADTTDTAARLQVAAWIDLGELGNALALSRRGFRTHPDDPAWARARLDALAAAGMDPWIADELSDAHLKHAAQVAVHLGLVEQGRAVALPATDEGPDAELARVWVALKAHDTVPAKRVMLAESDMSHLRLRAAVAKEEADRLALVELLDVWPQDPDTDLAPFAPLWGEDAPRAQARVLEGAKATLLLRADALIAGASPAGWLRTAELLRAIGDKARLGALADRIDADRGGPVTPDLLGAALSVGTEAWDLWEVARRPRWSKAMIDAAAGVLGRQEAPDFPWARPDEAPRLAAGIARLLVAHGQDVDADRLLSAHGGVCARPVGAEWAVVNTLRREGRAQAEHVLLRCVGSVDPMPAVDPANLDVDRQISEAAGGWRDFGRVMALGGWKAEAAIAFGISARLAPDDEVIALARVGAPDADLPVDGHGLPSVPGLLAALDRASFLQPESAFELARAAAVRTRTAAWLDPTPAHLAARVTPPRACGATLRDRCALEVAVAYEAARRGSRSVPADLPTVQDLGAARAAGPWLDRLQRSWFARSAALDRLSTEGARPDLAAILALGTGVRVGRPIPDFDLSGVRSTDLRGNVLVLSFWASWCRPCFAELPLVDALAKAWARDRLPVRVMAISVDDDVSRYARALAKLPWDTMSVVRDPTMRRDFQVDTLPTTYVVDATGVLRSVSVGYDGSNLGALDQAVRSWSSLASQ